MEQRPRIVWKKVERRKSASRTTLKLDEIEKKWEDFVPATDGTDSLTGGSEMGAGGFELINLELEPATVGFMPTFEEGTSSQVALITLLQLAAEIEHVLMVQYLYTRVSTTNPTYRDVIHKVALQEMGHFMSVQNVLLGLGGIKAVHLYKSFLRTDNPHKPLPYTLEPLSKDVLRKFTVIEMPADLMNDPEFKPLVDKVEADIHMHPNPVGLLYAQIINLLDGPGITFNDESAYLAERSFWHSTALDENEILLEETTTIYKAKCIIKKIAEQGEGPDQTPKLKTHFEMFYDLYKKFTDADTVTNIAYNPVLVANPEFDKNTVVENEYSRLWLKLASQQYTVLINDIYGSVITKPLTGTDFAENFSGFAFVGMKLVNDLTAKILQLPVLHSVDDVLDLQSNYYCGPTFELPDGEFMAYTDAKDFAARSLLLMTSIKQAITDIKKHKYYDVHTTRLSDLRNLLKQVEKYANDHEQLLTQINTNEQA